MLDWLAHQAISRPGGVALIYAGRQWTYTELNELVADMAGRLTSAGVGAGGHVAVLMPNHAEFVCTIHALARLGAVLVPLNVRLTPRELGWQVNQADCELVLCSRETENRAASLPETGEAGVSGTRVLSVDQPEEPRIEALADQRSQTAAFRTGRPLDLDGVQGIVFTSGTTGRPKGAMLTFANHLTSATASAFRLGTLPEDRWLACMPLYHVGGLAIVLRCCLYGTTLVLQDGFDPAAVSQAIDSQRITLVSLVPTMLHRILEARGDRPFPPSLRCVLLGGAGVSPALLERSLALGIPVATTYGLTEAASQVATASPDDVRSKAGGPPALAGHYVGRPLMFTQVRIAGDGGEEVPAGEIGEIVVSGPAVMRGYYRQPEAAAGDLRTGDLGCVDEAGDLWVVQRRSDLIVTGGENVYPAEVEEVLRSHPAVEDVCVIGVADAEWGQRVAAVVVAAENTELTEGELAAFCEGRLAGYKRPRVVRFVSHLPRTPSGKVSREGVAALMSGGDV